MICRIWVRRSLGIRSRCPFRIRPFSTLRSGGHSFRYSGHPWKITSFRWLSTISWLVWFRISSNLAGLAGGMFVIALTSRRGTPWCPSGGSMQKTLERALAITFVFPWMYLVSTLYLAIFSRSLWSHGDALGMVFFQMLSSGLWSVSMTTLLRKMWWLSLSREGPTSSKKLSSMLLYRDSVSLGDLLA